jgi:hypothetical protein
MILKQGFDNLAVASTSESSFSTYHTSEVPSPMPRDDKWHSWPSSVHSIQPVSFNLPGGSSWGWKVQVKVWGVPAALLGSILAIKYMNLQKLRFESEWKNEGAECVRTHNPKNHYIGRQVYFNPTAASTMGPHIPINLTSKVPTSAPRDDKVNGL